MRSRWLWIIGGTILLLAVIFVAPRLLGLEGIDREAAIAQFRSGQQNESTDATIPVQPASAVIGSVSASGNIALNREHYVVLGVDGIIAEVRVKPGDRVQAGDLLLAIDTIELERAVRRAELNVQSQVNRQQQVEQEADASDLLVAQANLASALEDLAQVRAGPSNQEIAAARSTLSSAWARHNELLAGPSKSELVQLTADMRRKEVALAEAQEEYNAVAWRNDVGMTPQASALQQATIDYETAVANHEQATAGASQSDLQSALSSAQSAQSQLDDLLSKPTEADIANAEAQVAQAQANLDNLIAGATATDLQDAQISLEQSLIDLQEAYANLAKAQVSAPIDGTILTVAAEAGQQGNRGSVIVTMADTTQLELTINVSEIDISQVELGQAADITIDALPGQVFRGSVAAIAPASDPNASLVNYPVTIHLSDSTVLDKVRPGMTAVATLVDLDSNLQEGWLVPTTALHTQDGSDVVAVVRNGSTITLPVQPTGVQGEWTIVQTGALQLGDEVVGSVTSRITNDINFGPGQGGRPGSGGSGGGQSQSGQ